MSFLNDIYYKSLAENERNIRFWEDYLNNLKSLDFSAFADKLRVPALVPIGNRIFFRGELKHTNEVTVALGADYFTKCSLKQAEVLRQHRIKGAQAKLYTFKHEREYIENQLSFSKQNVYEHQGQEIIEVLSEDEDKAWRDRHRENVKQYKQRKSKESPILELKEVTDEKLWDRLEELELQEELKNELLSSREVLDQFDNVEEYFVTKEDNKKYQPRIVNREQETTVVDRKKKSEVVTENTTSFDILQKVLDKQNELEEKMFELRQKNRSQSKTETDLISRLDEMEQLDDLEDEMDRLEDIIQTEDVGSDEDTISSSSQTKPKKGVSFADEDDSETLEITFTHTDIEPFTEPYNAGKGIMKPSDIYEAYSNAFGAETTSILKKSKYNDKDSFLEVPKVRKEPKQVVLPEVEDIADVDKTILVKDVVEKVNQGDSKMVNTASRPSSLFKKKRQQMKS